MSFPKQLRSMIERFPRLAMTYRLLYETRLLSSKPQQTPLGFLFNGHDRMVSGTFEPEETVLVTDLLKETEVFINVGANIGYYCCIALAQGKPTIAFEPIPTNLQYLYKNIHANGWDEQIEVFPVALSNRSGLVEMYGGGTGASMIKGWSDISANYKTLVPVSTMDAILGKRFDKRKCLVLVDIEGAEHEMLQGSMHLLQMTPRPTWIVEITFTKHQPKGVKINPKFAETFNLFWENGYEAWTINRAMRQLAPEEINRMVKDGNKTYSGHNILFVEPGKYPQVASGQPR